MYIYIILNPKKKRSIAKCLMYIYIILNPKKKRSIAKWQKKHHENIPI